MLPLRRVRREILLKSRLNKTTEVDFKRKLLCTSRARVQKLLEIFMRGFFSPPRLIEEFYQLSHFFTFFHLFSPFLGPRDRLSGRSLHYDKKKVKKGESW